MGSINIYGQSAGSIKIENTWIREILRTTPEKEDITPEKTTKITSAKKYLAFTQEGGNSNYPVFTPLLAGTPLWGTYKVAKKDDKGNVVEIDGEIVYEDKPFAPDNAVVTVSWLRAYLAGDIPSSGSPFSPDDFATKAELTQLANTVETFKSQIETNTTNIQINANKIKEQASTIANLSTRLAQAILDVEAVTGRVDDITSDPWPDGLILICGE